MLTINGSASACSFEGNNIIIIISSRQQLYFKPALGQIIFSNETISHVIGFILKRPAGSSFLVLLPEVRRWDWRSCGGDAFVLNLPVKSDPAGVLHLSPVRCCMKQPEGPKASGCAAVCADWWVFLGSQKSPVTVRTPLLPLIAAPLFSQSSAIVALQLALLAFSRRPANCFPTFKT